MSALMLDLDPVLSYVCAASLSLVLLLGALTKLKDLSAWREAAEAYALLPERWVGPVSAGLALAELAAGLLLLPIATRPLGAALALAVLATVSAAVALALLAGRSHIDCGCGVGSAMKLSVALLWRNLGLAVPGALALLPQQPRSTGWFDVIATCAAVLFALGLYAVINQLLANQPRLENLRNAP
jgi:hypothetical protein